jgi:hypothetical protein
MGEATLKHAQPRHYAAGKLDPWVTAAHEPAGAAVGGQVLREQRPVLGFTRLSVAYDALQLEVRRLSKVSALGELHGVSCAGLKAMSRLNKDFAIASARSHAGNNRFLIVLVGHGFSEPGAARSAAYRSVRCCPLPGCYALS